MSGRAETNVGEADERLKELLARAGRRHRPKPGWQRDVWGVLDAPPASARGVWAWPPGWILAVLGAAAIFVGGLGGAGAFYATRGDHDSPRDLAEQFVEDFGATVSTEVASPSRERIEVAPPPTEETANRAPKDAGRARETERATKKRVRDKEAGSKLRVTCGSDDPLCGLW